MASLGSQALDETANPELLSERQAELYRAKGYSEEWIERRVQSIEARKRLTDEWKKRGVSEGKEYSHLTATIAKNAFGLTPSEHAQLKNLDKENLRDHMNPLELLFTALSEETTRMIAEKDDAQGFNDNHQAAEEGGRMAGKYRQQLEERTGEKVVTSKNYLHLNAAETPKQIGENTENPTE
jgi:DNA-damage-inducible protein D